MSRIFRDAPCLSFFRIYELHGFLHDHDYAAVSNEGFFSQRLYVLCTMQLHRLRFPAFNVLYIYFPPTKPAYATVARQSMETADTRHTLLVQT